MPPRVIGHLARPDVDEFYAELAFLAPLDRAVMRRAFIEAQAEVRGNVGCRLGDDLSANRREIANPAVEGGATSRKDGSARFQDPRAELVTACCLIRRTTEAIVANTSRILPITDKTRAGTKRGGACAPPLMIVNSVPVRPA